MSKISYMSYKIRTNWFTISLRRIIMRVIKEGKKKLFNDGKPGFMRVTCKYCGAILELGFDDLKSNPDDGMFATTSSYKCPCCSHVNYIRRGYQEY